ncbi:MAG: hypothetical protein ACI8UO_004496 [Verrucomicrobiales bacterium]|jgi:hypothetical protein
MRIFFTVGVLATLVSAAHAQSKAEIEAAIVKAVQFYHGEVANHGGYVYKYSSDLTLREAEGYPDEDTIWIQPPGTPTVAEAFLDAYEATDNHACSIAALDAARALVVSQLHSGGWHYRAHLDGEKRGDFSYRRNLDGSTNADPVPDSERTAKGGWATWRKRDFGPKNQTVFDDDVTQAALRSLIRVDHALKFEDERIHEAAEYGLAAMLGTQYPSGGWSANFDRFPSTPTPDESAYPVKKATLPANPPKTWPKDFSGCYVTNDNLHANNILTLLLAFEVYQDKRYLESAKLAGEFLILAQLPDPQPAWAQQYDSNMQPVWDRAFEPAAVSGRESQQLLHALIEIYRVTKEEKFAEPVPRAVAYLRSSLLDDGKISRFYELGTNRPIYFTRSGGSHAMTYERKRLASNYGWIIEPELDEIEANLRAAKAGQPRPTEPIDSDEVTRIVESLDDRGAWTEEARPDLWIRDAEGRKQAPAGGIIQSATFIRNIEILSRALD